MPAKDAIHDAVRSALVKDGWVITADPYTIRYEELLLLADLSAEHGLSAMKGGDKIVVEIKSFSGASAMQDFKLALGQYLIYRVILNALSSDCRLWLAIPQKAHVSFFSQSAIRLVVEQLNVALLVIDIDAEEVLSWKR